MRNIKFRYVYKNKETGKIIYEYFSLYDIEQMETSPEYYHCNFDVYDLISRDQFTDIKDKNNEEIYEKDIIKISSNPNNCIVIWDNNWGCYQSIPYWKELIDIEDVEYLLADNINIEIIGNIYENQELVEG